MATIMQAGNLYPKQNSLAVKNVRGQSEQGYKQSKHLISREAKKTKFFSHRNDMFYGAFSQLV